MKAAKAKTAFVCQECGSSSQKWLGRCPSCSAWNTLVEERVREVSGVSPARGNLAGERSRALSLREVEGDEAKRIHTRLKEFDRVLGGGVVVGGVTLLGGDPGIGKSTLLMQVLAGLVQQGNGALYVTGEESSQQVALRAARLGVRADDAFLVHATSDLEDVLESIARHKPKTVVIDSIQTIRSPNLESAAGSVSQLREVTATLVEVAKKQQIALFLIGHVTKDGSLAGPKVLEHLVDTVLAFEGDAGNAYRTVRAIKNRFGPAHELAVYEMQQDGLIEVPEPSVLFLRERCDKATGSLVMPSAESTRPILLEVQALTAPAAYGAARRVCTGLDASRLAVLLAVLDRKCEVHLLDRDVFANVAGGARIEERAADLPLSLAVVSSFRNRAIDAKTVAFGEVGLTGELRAVPRASVRIEEAKKLGFTRVICAYSNLEQLRTETLGIELVGVRTLNEALQAVF